MPLDSEASSKARIGHFFEERLGFSTELAKMVASATFYLMSLSAQAALTKDGKTVNNSVASALTTAETSDWKP